MPCCLTVRLRDGRTLEKEKSDYEGFFTRPASWETVYDKFEKLTAPYADAGLRKQIVDAVAAIDEIQVSDLTTTLSKVPDPTRRS
jgi:2-methylcitrate dehydratase